MPVDAASMSRRRWLVFAVNSTTFAAILTGFVIFLAGNGMSVSEWLVFACFLLTLPYTVLAFWNAMIGLALRHGPHKSRNPLYGMDAADNAPLARVDSRTAIVMTLRNERPEPIFERLAWMRNSLVATGQAELFRFCILSDTDVPAIAAAEHRCMARFAADQRMRAPFYRRRERNTGYKAGNIAAFLDTHGPRYRFFAPLDSDSLMSGPVLIRLVAALEAHPEVGILQTLAVGMPSASGFTRIFQFGMRHAMRVFAAGAAWWTGDCGAYWGHNALIRTAAFSRHCRLPELPAGSPLGGAILSHDQLEAAFIRRAGFEVRVAAVGNRELRDQSADAARFHSPRAALGPGQHAVPAFHPLARPQSRPAAGS